MSGFFESVRWNACVYRLDLGLYSHPKLRIDIGLYSHPNEFFGRGRGGGGGGCVESEPMLTPREKSPLLEKFSTEEDLTHDAASNRTGSLTHYQRAIPTPHQCVRYNWASSLIKR